MYTPMRIVRRSRAPVIRAMIEDRKEIGRQRNELVARVYLCLTNGKRDEWLHTSLLKEGLRIAFDINTDRGAGEKIQKCKLFEMKKELDPQSKSGVSFYYRLKPDVNLRDVLSTEEPRIPRQSLPQTHRLL